METPLSAAREAIGPERLLFADFELLPATGELRKAGVRVKLQPRPAEVLELLATRAGELVSREEIRRHVWGEDTYVDFEQSLNFAIKQIRRALGDSAEAPRFIGTVPKHGYRFLAPVRSATAPPATPSTSPASVVPRAALPGVLPRDASGRPEAAHEDAARGSTPDRPAPREATRRWLAHPWALLTVVVAISLLPALKLVLAYRGAAAPVVRPRLAVMPFESPAAAAGIQPLDGLTEDVITELARRDPAQLGVIARASVMAYEGSTATPREVGRELGVDYLVTGSVRGADDGVRIAVQLVRAADETNVWAESYRGQLGPELAREIAAGVTGALDLAPERRGSSYAAVPPAAYDAYLGGRYLSGQGDWPGAVAAFRRAVELAPGFARAHAALAGEITKSTERPEKEVVPTAFRAARRALELEPELEEAHLAMARLQLEFLFDWRAAGREIDRALKANPGLAPVHVMRARYLASLGRHDEAIAAMLQAQELDPVSLAISSELAWHHYLARRYDDAIHQARRTLDLDPHQDRARQILIQAATITGDRETARAALAARAADLGWALAVPPPARLENAEDYWAWQLQVLTAWSKLRSFPPPELAVPVLAGGDRERALGLLEQGCRERYGSMLAFLAVDPFFDPLRGDPRFARLLDRIGVPDEAATRHVDPARP